MEKAKTTYKERIALAMGGGEIPNSAVHALAKKMGVSYTAVKKLVEPNGGTKALTAENNAVAAKHLGVNSEWLATGKGSMISEAANAEVPLPTSQADDLDAAFVTIADVIKPASDLQRGALVQTFTAFVKAPELVHDVARQVRALLLPPPLPSHDSDNGSRPKPPGAPSGGPYGGRLSNSRFPDSAADDKRTSVQGKKPKR